MDRVDLRSTSSATLRADAFLKHQQQEKKRKMLGESSCPSVHSSFMLLLLLFSVLSLTFLSTTTTGFTLQPRPVTVQRRIHPDKRTFFVDSSSTTTTRSAAAAAKTLATSSSLTSLHSSSSSSDDNVDGSAEYDYECDILVVGAGPTGRAVSSLLVASTKNDWKVMLADANHDKPFVPNYGVWRDEWDSVLDRYGPMGVDMVGGRCGEAINRAWPVTDCFFGGSFGFPMDQRTRLDRSYMHVDTKALQDSLTDDRVTILPYNHASKAIGVNLYGPSGTLVHDETGSTIQLQSKDGSETVTVRAKLIVDATGHETKLVLRDTKADGHRPPGFQIAYGCLLDLDESNVEDKSLCGYYDKEATTLLDYRTDHLEDDPDALERATLKPSFLYVLPMQDNKVFFEETSLVGRPALSYHELKFRCYKRLQHHGIKVSAVEKEEFVYIPMIGSLPIRGQRVIGLGGASAMVHPSTGYLLVRMLLGVADTVDAIEEGLLRNDPPEVVAASAYHAMLDPETIRERNFAVFGGEFLLQQDVETLRGFFVGFFAVSLQEWSGFLGGWPGLPHNDQHYSWWARLRFGLNFFFRIPPAVGLSMWLAFFTYYLKDGNPFLQSVSPVFGEPASYDYEDYLQANAGDAAAKAEAREMIRQSTVSKDVPAAFDPPDQQPEQQQPTTETRTTSESEVVLP